MLFAFAQAGSNVAFHWFVVEGEKIMDEANLLGRGISSTSRAVVSSAFVIKAIFGLGSVNARDQPFTHAGGIF